MEVKHKPIDKHISPLQLNRRIAEHAKTNTGTHTDKNWGKGYKYPREMQLTKRDQEGHWKRRI